MPAPVRLDNAGGPSPRLPPLYGCSEADTGAPKKSLLKNFFQRRHMTPFRPIPQRATFFRECINSQVQPAREKSETAALTSPRSVCQSSINPRAPIPHRFRPTVQQWSIPDSFALRKHVEGSTDRPPEFTVPVPRLAIARAASWRWVAALGFLRAKTSSLTCTRHNLSSQNSSWRNSLRSEGALGRKLGRRGCALLAAGSAAGAGAYTPPDVAAQTDT